MWEQAALAPSEGNSSESVFASFNYFYLSMVGLLKHSLKFYWCCIVLMFRGVKNSHMKLLQENLICDFIPACPPPQWSRKGPRAWSVGDFTARPLPQAARGCTLPCPAAPALRAPCVQVSVPASAWLHLPMCARRCGPEPPC